MAESDPSVYLNVGQLADLCIDWPAERLVWIDAGTGLHRVRQAGHLDPGGDGGAALTLRSYGVGEVASQPAAQVWIVEWAAPPGVTLPATTAHRTRAAARRQIRSLLLAAGLDPDAAVEETRAGMLMGDLGELGDLVYMLRTLDLLP